MPCAGAIVGSYSTAIPCLATSAFSFSAKSQPYYRGAQTPVFATDTGPETRRLLRLLPDREGPITLLKAFGDLVFWRELDSVTVAPPWLIYAELMQSPDPRAHEAAEEFHGAFLGR